MGNSIFVSYKYGDARVLPIPGIPGITTARHYVDEIGKHLQANDHIFKGENDGESMGTLQDTTISSKLGDKIFYSSVTIVLISKGMKQASIPDREQWIPWEVSYSLKEQSRAGARSKTNAMLAVVLPDENGSYEYFLTQNPACNSITYQLNTLFQILGVNMFNLKAKEANSRECGGQKIYEGYHSYIHPVRWNDFIGYVNIYIAIANSIKDNIENYTLTKTL